MTVTIAVGDVKRRLGETVLQRRLPFTISAGKIVMRVDLPAEIPLKTEKQSLCSRGLGEDKIRVNIGGWEDATPTSAQGAGERQAASCVNKAAPVGGADV